MAGSKLSKYRADHGDLNTSSRSAIIQAGQVLFLKQGIASTTMGDIAGQARVSRVTVYRNFPECGAVAFEVYNHMLDSILEATRTGLPSGISGLDAARHCLGALFAAYPAQESAFRFCAVFSSFHAVEERSDEMTEWYGTREFRGLAEECASFFSGRLDQETSNRLMALTDAAANGLCGLAVTGSLLDGTDVEARLHHLKELILGQFDSALASSA